MLACDFQKLHEDTPIVFYSLFFVNYLYNLCVCLSLMQSIFLVISKNEASGDYPGCTDLAYSKTINDGADVIDCLVQMTKDGIPFWLSAINLVETTIVAQSSFSNLTKSAREVMPGSGIFTFDLTWSDIQSSSLRHKLNYF